MDAVRAIADLRNTEICVLVLDCRNRKSQASSVTITPNALQPGKTPYGNGSKLYLLYEDRQIRTCHYAGFRLLSGDIGKVLPKLEQKVNDLFN